MTKSSVTYSAGEEEKYCNLSMNWVNPFSNGNAAMGPGAPPLPNAVHLRTVTENTSKMAAWNAPQGLIHSALEYKSFEPKI